MVLVEFAVLECKKGETNGRDCKLLLGRSFMATVGMVVDVRSRNISFSCGGKSVNFMVDSLKMSQVEDCLVLEAPKSRKKRSQVFTLVQAFEGVNEMEMGSQDCLKEIQECVLEEEEVIFKEIGELKKENTKLKPEVYLLKTENGMLKTKVHKFSTLNKSLEEQLVELAKKEELGSKNQEELARLSTEFEEENGRRSRKMLLSVETSAKSMLDLQERLNRKEDELKRAKVKECDLIIQLDGAENVMIRRTRQSAKQGSQVPERRTRRGPQVPPSCVRHTDFEDCLEYFKEWDIVVERGITLDELVNTPIPQVVETRGWETFVSTPPIYCRSVVKEFYTGMVSEDFQRTSTVLVCGVQVRMTITNINKYYRTELPDDQEAVGRLRNRVTWNNMFVT
ncbi:hypothetical protein LWI28_022132 [Acer negundo]|uniref:Uncharacterized protein n=1 Tax=Acer negundo TaxID=4023 RepID=A0AAD5NN46_ACENE|nr:hypothetical protein LWI28_022132 [Acer negundo]